MGEAAALALMKGAELRNRLRLLRRQSRFKLAVIAIFSVAFWWAFYQICWLGLRAIHVTAASYSFTDLPAAMLFIFFFAMTLMLVFSNAIISYTSCFKSKETSFLIAAPLSPGSIFLYKFTESLTFSSWAFVFFGTPLMAAYGRLYDASWHFYVSSAAFLAAFMFIPAALGSMASMIVTAFVPRTRRAMIIGVGVAAALLVLILVSRLLAVQGRQQGDLKMAIEVFESFRFSRHPLLPSFWVSKGIMSLTAPGTSTPLFFFGLIAANALFLTSLAHRMSRALLVRGWAVAQGLRSVRRYRERGIVDRLFDALLFFVNREVRLIVIKDVKSFIRDPVQWTQFLIFFGLLGVYFLNLRAFAYDEGRDIFWKNVIAQMNILATSLTLATFASRFIFPQLSLEGRRFWVIGMAPMERDRILFGKMALCFTCSLIISETLITVSSVMLRTPRELAILHAVSLFGICLGLSGLSVGLGALYPNFNEDNPSKIVSGFGGTLNLVLSMLFVMSVLGAQAVPCFMHYGRSLLSPVMFKTAIVASMGVIALLSLVACLVPMSMGLKALRRLEV